MDWLFRYEPFINFWLRFFDTRKETILKSLSYHTTLTTPKCSAHLVVQSQFLNTMVGPQLLNIIVGPNFWPSWSNPNFNWLPQWQTSQLSAYIVQNQLPILFFKIFQFSGPSLPGMTSFTLQLIFYLGFIRTIVIVISFAHECKLYLMLCTWSKRRIDQSPTKLNNKI